MLPVISSFRTAMRAKRVSEPVVFYTYWILRAAVLLVAVRSVFDGRYEYALLSFLVLVLLMVPSFLERALDIELPDLLEVVILVFIFAAEILGEIDAFYVKFPFWDTMLHTTWGFLCAAIGFAMFDILNRSSAMKIRLTPLYMAVSAFAFSMAIGAIWEIFEFSMDSLLGFDMQKDTLVTAFNTVWLDPTASNTVVPVHGIVSTQVALGTGETVAIAGGYLDIGLLDTMADLIVNLIGAAVFSVFGYLYVKNRGKGGLAARLIPRTRYRGAEENDQGV